MLRKRIATSAWFVTLFVTVLWFGGEVGFTALMAVFGVLAAVEFYRMAHGARLSPLAVFGIVWTALFVISRNSQVLAAIESVMRPGLVLPLLLTTAVIPPLLWLLSRRQKREAFVSWAWTIAGMFYIGWLLSHMVALRGLADGVRWVFFVLLVTWHSDTAAFFAGRWLGKHKLAPSISPGKTWQGAIGGIGGAIGISVLFFTPTSFQLSLLYWQVIPLAIGVSVLGQCGDLVESLLKRNVGVKDSGTFMPGHGGMLDRMDSILFAGTLVYYAALLA